MRDLGLTPSQTVGPFFHYALTPDAAVAGEGAIAGPVVATAGAVGERIGLVGVVLDGIGAPVADAMIEIWQADGAGRLATAAALSHGAFSGFGRAATDAAGGFRFETVKPAPLGPGQAPHIVVAVFGRGLLNWLVTRVYFDDEAANAADPVLAVVPPERRATLIARRHGAEFHHAIRLRGEAETVFFTA
jgi:protocatechuate 3,4-dioxygenase alpha subunit